MSLDELLEAVSCQVHEEMATPVVALAASPPARVHPGASDQAADIHQTPMGVPDLDGVVSQLLDRGVATATLTSYASGKRRYLAFCRQFQLTPLPADEATLCLFAAFLFVAGLSYASVRSYLSAVCHLHVVHEGLPDPSREAYPRLEYVLKGFHRESSVMPVRKQLPINPAILHSIHATWSQGVVSWEKSLSILPWICFMRAGEFTCPS